jgi:predicted esterase
LIADPHGGQPVLQAGASAEGARAGLILVHGRGATAAGMLPLAREIGDRAVAVRAPQAAGNTWYPLSFLSPLADNEPGLCSGLARIDSVIESLGEAGLPVERIVLLGFSQGACLTAEYLLRNPERYGGAVLLTGGFQGPAGRRPAVDGTFRGTPVFLGSSDPDPHVPWSRVEETAAILENHGAAVETRRYPGMPHTIAPDEIEAAAAIVRAVVDSGSD